MLAHLSECGSCVREIQTTKAGRNRISGMFSSHQPMPDVPGVSHQYINAGGLRTHVAVAGPESGDPVLLLHGWPEHWWLWRHAMPALADAGYRVYAPDLRGFGWSEATPNFADYDKRNFASDILALITALKIDRPIRLAGHDWGGWTGFLIAIREPQLFDRFFALNISPPWDNPGPFDLKESLKALAKLRYQVPLALPGLSRWTQAGGGRKLLSGGVVDATYNRDAWKDGALDVFLDQFKEEKRSRATMMLYRRFLTHEVPLIATGRYVEGRLTVPTKMLFGMGDVAVSPDTILADHSRKADHFTVETVENCGHFIVDEQPELVTEKMLEWFAVADPKVTTQTAAASAA